MGFDLGGAFSGGLAGFQMAGPWGALAGAGIGGVAGGRAKDKQKEADRINDMNEMRRYEAQLAAREANSKAMVDHMLRLNDVEAQALSGRQEAFNYMKQAGDEKDEAQRKLSEGLTKFGKEQAGMTLSEAKKKKRAAALGAVKGNKAGKLGKGKGRLSSAFGSGVQSARAQGLARAMDVAGMKANLMGYGEMMGDQFSEMSGMAAQGAQHGMAAKDLEQISRARQAQANTDRATGSALSGQQYQLAQDRARQLGYLPPDPTIRIGDSTTDKLLQAGQIGIGAYGIYKGMPRKPRTFTPGKGATEYYNYGNNERPGWGGG